MISLEEPAAVRVELARLREQGFDFETAWLRTVGPPAGEQEMRKFMESHFRAAYYRTPSSLGRFQAEAEESYKSDGRVPIVVGRDREGRCRSGDGCDRAAGHGLTGAFCEHHAGELARIRESCPAVKWDGKVIARAA